VHRVVRDRDYRAVPSGAQPDDAPMVATATKLPQSRHTIPVAKMSSSPSNLAGTGLEVIDLGSDPDFASRHLHTRDVAKDMSADLDRLSSLVKELLTLPVPASRPS
jgi:hypothetical protein